PRDVAFSLCRLIGINRLFSALRVTRQRIWVYLYRLRPDLFADQHILGFSARAISRFHITFVERYDGAFEFESCEQPLAARIRQDLRVDLHIRPSSGLPSHLPS